MPIHDSEWSKLSIEKKLDWLRAAIEQIISTANNNLDARNTQTRGITTRLDAVEAEAKNIAREVRKLQRKDV